ncbi:MAG: o-succinylbenzoate--CoA ligase [bacterium]|nr:o-succinylbenzoate--CoA ligase [bacterium]
MNETVTCPVYRFAQLTPDSPAIITEHHIYSYYQLEEMVSWFARKFQFQGIGRGIRVGLPIGNSPTYIAILSALWRIGATAVPLNPRFPGDYLETVFRRLGIHCSFLWENYSPMEGFQGKGTLHPPSIHLEDDATIILTSGSTAAGKAALHTYGNHYFNALGSNENILLEPGHRWLLSLPLCHVGGLGILFRSFLAGAAVVIPMEKEPLGESIRKHLITHASLVSTQLYRLLEETQSPGPEMTSDTLSSLKVLLLGGSAFSEPLIRKALVLQLPIYTTYGLTEMSSQVTTTPPGASPEKLSTSGKVLSHRYLKISESREILVSGHTRFKGYVEGDSLTRPFDEDGWFTTGDLGALDADGYLQVLGRKDNMFISGGENIMPEEIEAQLNRIPGVEQSVVVAVENKVYGARPAAFLKTRNPEQLTKEYVIERLQQTLPRFKIPDAFYLWPPNTDEKTLKVKRSFYSALLKLPQKPTLMFKK